MPEASFFDQVRRFYEAERSALYTYALAITGSAEAAEDAVHAAVARLLRRGSAPRALKPYVFRAVRNAAVDHHRRRREAPLDGLETASAATPVDPELRPTLLACLAELPIDQREVVLLKVIGGLTLREIARARGRSQNTVASWYRRGLSRLRLLLEERP